MPKKPTKYLVHTGYARPLNAIEKYHAWIKQYEKQNRVKVKLVFLYDEQRELSSAEHSRLEMFDLVLPLDFSTAQTIQEGLLPYVKDILAVLCRSESFIPYLAKLVPHVPYNKLPTSDSLLWSVNKLQMRRRFKSYNSKITPKFREVKSAEEVEIDKIEKQLSYPMIVKPYGLAQSLLVTNVYHRDELRRALKRSFKSLKKIYAQEEKCGDHGLLVEELMEGSQYSIDCYVNSKGKIYYCPPVYVKTGKQIGFDDYFGYRQMTPTKLRKSTIEEAQAVTHDAIYALGLRSTTAHVELLRTEQGWKVIEVAPRVGGFREEIYDMSYGFHHAHNDILIRMGKKPLISKQVRGYTAAMKLYAKKEGVIVSVRGVQKMQKLASFVRLMSKPSRKGDRATFAKHGGKSIVNVLLHNKERSKLLADIRRLEQMFEVKVR